MASRGTVRTPDSEIAWVSTGEGGPVTVFAHGLGSSIEETRLLAAGVSGTQVFLSFRGHARSTEDAGARFSYDALADDLAAVADRHGATRAMGVSVGSAALLRLLTRDPARFERVVFFLPAVLDRPRADGGFDRIRRLADLVAASDVDGIEALLLEQLPQAVRRDPKATTYTRTRAANLARLRLDRVVDGIADETLVRDLTALQQISAPALVVTQDGDDVHPARIGRRLAQALPAARLEEFGIGQALWSDLPRLYRVLKDFLG